MKDELKDFNNDSILLNDN